MNGVLVSKNCSNYASCNNTLLKRFNHNDTIVNQKLCLEPRYYHAQELGVWLRYCAPTISLLLR